jgi:peptidoglycan/LPS O-acetylase OafA/YrhL
MLINVQFLRFAAAMMVVFYHTSSHVRASGIEQGMLFSLSEAVGFAGVDIFFVISGFIMAHTTATSAGAKASWAFARRRLARIYSGYWPFFLIALAVFAWANPEQLKMASLVRSWFLWPANNLLLAVSWTLIFELFFYVVYTLLIFCSEDRRTLMLKFFLVFIMAWSTYSQFGRHAYDMGHLEFMSLAEYYMLSPYLAEFLAGAIVAVWLRHHPDKHGWTWLAAGCVCFVLAGWVNKEMFAGEIEQGYHVFFRVLLFGSASLMILTGLVRLERAAWKAPVRFSVLVGGASYAIYLSHTLVLTISQYLGFNSFAGGLGDWPARLLFIGLTLIILAYSVAHYRIFERPLHQRFKRALGIS